MDYYSTLTDDEIREALTEAGLPVGPIVDSTRKVYIRKLQRLARDVQESEAPVEAVDDESEEEEEVRPAARPARPMTAKTRSSPQKTPPPAAGDGDYVRQRRTQQRKLDVPIEKEIQEPSRGIGSIIFNLLVLLVVVGVVLFVVGLALDEGPMKLLAGGSDAGKN